MVNYFYNEVLNIKNNIETKNIIQNNTINLVSSNQFDNLSNIPNYMNNRQRMSSFNINPLNPLVQQNIYPNINNSVNSINNNELNKNKENYILNIKNNNNKMQNINQINNIVNNDKDNTILINNNQLNNDEKSF